MNTLKKSIVGRLGPVLTLTKAVAPSLAAAALAAAAMPALAQSDQALLRANGQAAFQRCGTVHPSSEEARMIEEAFSSLRGRIDAADPNKGKPGGGGGGGGTLPGPGSITVEVVFHVISKDGTVGNVPDKWVADQMAVLNNSFAG